MRAIAIDGPAGAGKSSIAKILAKRLGYIYVDTGALYRAVGYFVVSRNISTTDAEAVIGCLDLIKIEMKYVDGQQRVFINDEDVTEKIRTAEISMAASNVSAIPKVREFLFDLQQNIAKTNNVVMDGRDIGTVVLPNADVKIFLTASPEERAKRRYKELIEKGQQATYEDVLADVITRDHNDSTRATAPLKQAVDAVLVDTSDLDFDQSVEALYNIAKRIGE